MNIELAPPPAPKKLVIYHDHCVDGFAAAWCFWRRYGAEPDYLPASYGDDPPEVDGLDVYLVDFSYPRAVVERLLERAASVTIIDHHKTAIEDLAGLGHPKLVEYVHTAFSGAALAEMFLCLECLPLIAHVSDRDLWQFKMEGTREVHAAITSYEFDFNVWDILGSLSIDKLADEGRAILRRHDIIVREIAESARRYMTIGHYAAPAACASPQFASDVGHALAGGAAFAATYYDTASSRVFSLRSRQSWGADVSEIARMYGGGGHRHAAGFRVPRDHALARA